MIMNNIAGSADKGVDTVPPCSSGIARSDTARSDTTSSDTTSSDTTSSDNKTVPVTFTVKPTCMKEYKVDYFCVDYMNRMKLSSLFNYMQDIAGIHANELGCGYDILSEHEITWIMLRAKIQMQYYPSWGDVITVKTSTNGVEKLWAVREFEFIDANGEIVGNAITYWILYDTVAHKVVRMNHSDFDLPEHLKKNYSDYEKITKIKEQGELISESIRIAQYSDIDTNIHVNNARYIEWITDDIYSSAVGRESGTGSGSGCGTGSGSGSSTGSGSGSGTGSGSGSSTGSGSGSGTGSGSGSGTGSGFGCGTGSGSGSGTGSGSGCGTGSGSGCGTGSTPERLIKSLHVGFMSSVKFGDIVNIKKFVLPENEKNEILRIYKDDTEYLQAEIEFF